jgi:hypothetical protein
MASSPIAGQTGRAADLLGAADVDCDPPLAVLG